MIIATWVRGFSRSSPPSMELRAVSALGQRLSEVRRLGFTKCLIPKRVQGKLSVPEGLDVIRVANILEALAAIL